MSRKKRSARKAETLLTAPRNPLFNHPLMKKSHVHDKPGKAKRRAEKVRFSKDWYSQSGLIQNHLKAILRMPVFSLGQVS
ncbi:hypothetical protein [sulfur-oxidizing endosymbiont of Gigantopelta aegis]|uniref:hypothetical protein n=1 Tax=sulfur-oxidizing endosymbiont of Gigantopelta aegis TaxID=2794934 RepID=UPI0018DD3413|nr:hypothetical protein [sulfur-oxidizing endosymbiont of Gigantopelta aegis]